MASFDKKLCGMALSLSFMLAPLRADDAPTDDEGMTPTQTAVAFWNALARDDQGTARSLSTLSEVDEQKATFIAEEDAAIVAFHNAEIKQFGRASNPGAPLYIPPNYANSEMKNFLGVEVLWDGDNMVGFMASDHGHWKISGLMQDGRKPLLLMIQALTIVTNGILTGSYKNDDEAVTDLFKEYANSNDPQRWQVANLDDGLGTWLFYALNGEWMLNLSADHTYRAERSGNDLTDKEAGTWQQTGSQMILTPTLTDQDAGKIGRPIKYDYQLAASGLTLTSHDSNNAMTFAFKRPTPFQIQCFVLTVKDFKDLPADRQQQVIQQEAQDAIDSLKSATDPDLRLIRSALVASFWPGKDKDKTLDCDGFKLFIPQVEALNPVMGQTPFGFAGSMLFYQWMDKETKARLEKSTVDWLPAKDGEYQAAYFQLMQTTEVSDMEDDQMKKQLEADQRDLQKQTDDLMARAIHLSNGHHILIHEEHNCYFDVELNRDLDPVKDVAEVQEADRLRQ